MSAVRSDTSSHRAQALEMLRSCSMIQKSQIKLATCARGPACLWWQCWGAPDRCAPGKQAATARKLLRCSGPVR